MRSTNIEPLVVDWVNSMLKTPVLPGAEMSGLVSIGKVYDCTELKLCFE